MSAGLLCKRTLNFIVCMYVCMYVQATNAFLRSDGGNTVTSDMNLDSHKNN